MFLAPKMSSRHTVKGPLPDASVLDNAAGVATGNLSKRSQSGAGWRYYRGEQRSPRKEFPSHHHMGDTFGRTVPSVPKQVVDRHVAQSRGVAANVVKESEVLSGAASTRSTVDSERTYDARPNSAPCATVPAEKRMTAMQVSKAMAQDDAPLPGSNRRLQKNKQASESNQLAGVTSTEFDLRATGAKPGRALLHRRSTHVDTIVFNKETKPAPVPTCWTERTRVHMQGAAGVSRAVKQPDDYTTPVYAVLK